LAQTIAKTKLESGEIAKEMRNCHSEKIARQFNIDHSELERDSSTEKSEWSKV
jgi:hypothetical protein